MKITILTTLLVLALLPAVASAATAVTVAGNIACLSEGELDDAITYAVNKDTASLQSLLDRGRCLILKGGLRVTVTDAGFTKHEFAYRGIKLWTVAEGLRVD